jgi:hypothetical protein
LKNSEAAIILKLDGEFNGLGIAPIEYVPMFIEPSDGLSVVLNNVVDQNLQVLMLQKTCRGHSDTPRG